MTSASLRSSSRSFLVASAALCCCLSTALNAGAQRLPTTVRPEHYSLLLTPDLKGAKFTGVETIDVTLSEPASAITVNSAEIAFQSVTVKANGKEQAATASEDKEKEQTTFTVPSQLPAGKATISIHYTGILNNELRGFYLSKTAKRNYAVTQFESTDARRAFPSFDEPAFKATFDISLVIDSGDTAISNGPIVSDTPGPGDGKHTLKFLTTPKMSTYLVAFLVGDFQCTEGESDGVKIRGCATPDKVDLTAFSVEIAKYVLHYYNSYFGIPYPLKKLDLIGLPDFEAGAMENFGAITYRETDMLLDPKTASLDAQKNVALVVAHEMAHQWFGDLVTMQWWDNIWLNEGFATWMENKPVAAMHPEWDIDQLVANDEYGQRTQSDQEGTMDLDAQPTTHAIRATANTREEIEQMFDGISYGKAGAVLLSVENYVGPETFRKGVHNYLAAHLYANATAEDFWNAQTATSHKPVDKIMESLVAQPGEPLLTFGEPANGSVSVSQKRFFLSPAAEPNPQQKWTIPVCLKTGKDKQDCEVLSPGDSSLAVPGTALFFANAGGKGYYRSAYPASVYSDLVAHVESGLTPTERISLTGDEWAQVRANKAAVGDFLDLVAALKGDSSAVVVTNATNSFNAIYAQIAATSQERSALDAWLSRTFAPKYEKLGPPSKNDSPNTASLRATLFKELGRYAKDPAILAQAREISAKYLADPASVDGTLARIALDVAARNGDTALFDLFQKTAETSTNPDLEEGALRMLAEFEDPALAQRSLEYAISGKVRNQDALFQVSFAMEKDATRDIAWKFIQSHWEAIHSLLTPELGFYLVTSAGEFCSADARDDVKSFFTEHKVPDTDRALKHALESIDNCTELRKLQEPNLQKWIAAQPTP